MGTRGPAPKREGQRRRRNKPDTPVEHVAGAGAPEPPPLDLPNAHHLAVDLYDALRNSAEAAYLTPAAWQRARVSALVLSQQLASGKPSAVMYSALQADWKALLIDAGELRRLGIEIGKAEAVDTDELAAVSALDEFRASRSG